MMRRTLPLALLVFVVCSLTITGCGEPALPSPVPVSGVLLLDGQPLAKAEIRFQPTAAGLPGDAGAYAVTDDQGKFTLTTAGKPVQSPGNIL